MFENDPTVFVDYVVLNTTFQPVILDKFSDKDRVLFNPGFTSDTFYFEDGCLLGCCAV
jgi:hypothetical protein